MASVRVIQPGDPGISNGIPQNKIQMSEEHRSRLMGKRDIIIRQVENVEEIAHHLLENSHITRIQAENVLSKVTRHEKARSLLCEVLVFRSEAAFHSFLEALWVTQPDLFLYDLMKDANTMSSSDRDIQQLIGTPRKYRNQLYEFHHRNLQSLSDESPHYYDMARYVKVGIHAARYKAIERCGTTEFSLIPIEGEITPVETKDIFSALNEGKDPRTVLMIGVPGIGKTMMCYYLLKMIVEAKIFRKTFNMVFFIKFRELNKIHCRLGFQDLVLDYFSPRVEVKDRKVISKFLDRYESETLYILDGYDEFQGLGCNINTAYRRQFSNIEGKEMPQVLIHNLIKGIIRPKSKVLVTSRPHCVSLLTGSYQRLVELNGLDDQQQKQMVTHELSGLPQLHDTVLKHLEEHKDIKSLCTVPAHLKSLLECIKFAFTSPGCKQPQNSMPRTKSAHLFLLMIKLLFRHDREVETSLFSGEQTCCDILRQKRRTIQKYAKLARGGLLSSKVAQVFSREDLESYELTEKETLNGILSSYLTCMTDRNGQVKKPLFAFPHLTHQEHLCSLELLKDIVLSMGMPSGTQNEQTRSSQQDLHALTETGFFQSLTFRGVQEDLRPEGKAATEPNSAEFFEPEQKFVLDLIPGMEVLTYDGKRFKESTNTAQKPPSAKDHEMQTDNIESMVQHNTGNMDMVLLLSLGTAGDPWSAELFKSLYPETQPTKYGQAVEWLLRVIWASARRHHSRGELFCIESLQESGQTNGNLADELACVLANPLNALNLLDTILSPKDCLSLGQFLSALSKAQFNTMMVKGQVSTDGLKSLLSAEKSYSNLIICAHHFEGKDWEMLSEHLDTTKSLHRLTLSSSKPLLENEECLFRVKDNSTIQCLGLMYGKIDDRSIGQVCVALKVFQQLEALDLTGNNLGTSDGICRLGALLILHKLKYLVLNHCDLGPSDMSILADIVITKGIRWLDISSNDITDIGAYDLSACLSDPESQVVGLGMVRCQFGPRGAKAVCRALANNTKLTILGLSQNAIGEAAPHVAEMLNRNTCLEEVHLENCGFNSEQSLEVFSAVKHHHRTRYISLSYSELEDNIFSNLATEVLRSAHLQLRALCLIGCGLTDKAMKAIVQCMQTHQNILLVNFSENRLLTANSIVSLVQHTRVQHIGLSKCFFDRNEMTIIGQAVVNSPHVVSCLVGDGKDGEDEELEVFLQEICQYPLNGSLKYLWLHASRPSLANKVCQAESALRGDMKIGFVQDAIAFLMASGCCWCTMPQDLCLWLSHASFHC